MTQYTNFQQIPTNAHAQSPVSDRAWALRWEMRSNQKTDWVASHGITVAAHDGVVIPINVFLRNQLTDFVAKLSGSVTVQRSIDEIDALVNECLDAVSATVLVPLADESSESHAIRGMLVANFADALLAAVDLMTAPVSPQTGITELRIDATTIHIIAPKQYNKVRAFIPKAVPLCSSFSIASSSGRGSRLSEDGQSLKPMTLRVLQNLLNVEFEGEAGSGGDARAAIWKWARKSVDEIMSGLSAAGYSQQDFREWFSQR